MSTPMKLVYRACVLTIVSAAAVVGPLSAQGPGTPDRHPIRIGFGGGVVVPTSHAADVLDDGINGQAFLLLDPGVGFPLRFNLGYQKFDYKEVVLDAASGQTSLLSGTAGLNLNLVRIGPLRSYLSAGLGAFVLNDQLADSSAGESAAELRFGIDGGGGFVLKLGRLEAFIEGRVQNVYTEKGAIDRKDIRAVLVTFGILF